MLAQQVSRALIKLAGEFKNNRNAKCTETTAFVAALYYADAVPFQAPTSPAEWLRPEVYTAALALRAARLVADLQSEIDGGRRFVDLSWESIEVAKAHAEVTVSHWFAEAIRDDAERFGSQASEWMSKMVTLHALTSLARNITPLALPMSKSARGLAAYPGGASILTAESVAALEAAIRTSVEELLPQVIPLTDAFGWTDWELASALGRKDGRVYESIMAEAQGNPLNHPLEGRQPGHYDYTDPNTGKHVVEWYKQEIQPLLKAAALRAEEPIRGDGSKL